MPYLYVAIGRRLGYPVSIALTHMHGYVYYDEGDGKHFNVEATENRGFVTPSDDEYRHPAWAAPSEPNYYEQRGLLKPMSNKEATAHILAGRAAVFRSAGRHDEEAKAWAIAARYFPDTPTWKQIAGGMQQAARLDEYQKWRDGIWKELASYSIPEGPGFAYFHDQRIKLHLFMNESLDRKAIEEAAEAYKNELAGYSKTAMKPIDGPLVALNSTNYPGSGTLPLLFTCKMPDGSVIRVPAEFLPPFARGELPMELLLRIGEARPQDPDALLEMTWEYYEQMQATDLARQTGERDRIASGRPVLISEESIPPEFRQGVPPDLAMELSGMHDAQDIAITLWQYKQQRQAIEQVEMLAGSADPVSAALRQAGVPDSVARMAGLPVSGPQGASDPSFAVAGMAGLGSLGGIPGMEGLAAQGMIPGGSGRPMASSGAWNANTKQVNDQMIKFAERQLRAPNTTKPAFALPYQVVPASVAATNPAVANPLPFGGLPNAAISPLSTVPINGNNPKKNNAP